MSFGGVRTGAAESPLFEPEGSTPTSDGAAEVLKSVCQCFEGLKEAAYVRVMR